MKLTLLIFVGLFAVALCCTSVSQCHHLTCGHGQVKECTGNQCVCTHHGKKREPHECNVDEDCNDYCNNHGGGNPTCVHHGDPAHGHNLCECH